MAADMRTGAPSCDRERGCITCSDEAIPMRVVEEAGAGLAICVDDAGRRSEVLTGLVEEARVGDRLLVHAGAALLRLEAPPLPVRGP